MKKIILLAFIVVTTMSSCGSYMASGAAFGGMIGSAVGGITGGARGSDIGTLIGAATGAAIGASADAHEREMYERRARQYDDVYYSSDRTVYRDVEKAKRIQQYHNNVANRHGASASRRSAASAKKSSLGYRLEVVDNNDDPMQQSGYLSKRSDDDKSGFTSEGKFDDRIEMK